MLNFGQSNTKSVILILSVATTLYILKQKQMRHLGKMKVSEAEYFLIIEESKKELMEINQDHLINWKQN